jgi:hypothetical protein
MWPKEQEIIIVREEHKTKKGEARWKAVGLLQILEFQVCKYKKVREVKNEEEEGNRRRIEGEEGDRDNDDDKMV